MTTGQQAMALLLTALLAGCTMAPDYERPSLETGSGWKDAAAGQQPIASDWWTGFKSANLDRLVPEAINANNDLAAAIARIRQAQAGVTTATAPLLPQIGASGGQDKSWRDANGTTTVSSPRNIGLNVSYALDLFGKARSDRDAAEARADASRYDYEALRIVTAVSTAKAYAGALTGSERLRVARDNLAIATDILGIITARFKAGSASALELAQQKAEVESANASIASLVAQHDSYLNQLAVLTGRAPQLFTVKEEALAALALPRLAPSLPSALLTQRPDIRSAEASLIAAHADIGSARAAFFPSVDLGAAAILNANPASSVLSLSASVLGTIFSGGTLEGKLETAKARQEELAAAYRQAVLTAFQETSDALAALRAAETRYKALTAATTQARTAYKLARARYDSGTIDFQTLLDTQRSLLQAEDSSAQARLDQITASLDLIAALGGGWTDAKTAS